MIAGTGTYSTAHSVHLTRAGARARRRRLPRRHAVLQQAAAARDRRALQGDRGGQRPADHRLQHPEPGRDQHRARDDRGARRDPERHRGEAGERPTSAQARRIVEETGLDLYAGDDDLLLPFLELGGIGGVCVHTHIVGPQVKELVRRFKRRRPRGRARDRRGAAARDRAAPRSSSTRSRSRRRSTCSATRSEACGSRSSRRRDDESSPRCARCLERLGVLARSRGPAAAARLTGADGAVRIIPLGGLGEVGKNMTVFELDGEHRRRRRRASRSRATSTSASTSSCRTSRYLAGPRRAGPRGRPHARARGPRRRAAVPAARGRGARRSSATRFTLGLVKSKLDEHGLLRAVELIEVDPADGPFEVGPFSVEFVRMAHSIPDAVAVVLDERRGDASSTRATTRSTTRRSTASGPTSAASPRSGTAASTSCSATRRTPSGRASPPSERTVGEAFRRSSRSARAGS